MRRTRRSTSARRVFGALATATTLAASLFGATGCGRYESNDLELLTAFSAKEMCSCLFVVGQTEEFCRTLTKQAPDVKSVTIDREAKTVRSQAAMMWGASARFVDKRHGCVLE